MTKEKKKRLKLIIGSQKKKKDAAAKLEYALTTWGLVIFWKLACQTLLIYDEKKKHGRRHKDVSQR